MRDILSGYSVDSRVWDEVRRYHALHPELSEDDVLDRLLEKGLQRADKATVHAPLELFSALVECTYKLARFAGMQLPTEVALQLVSLANSTHLHAQEFLLDEAMQWEDAS